MFQVGDKVRCIRETKSDSDSIYAKAKPGMIFTISQLQDSLGIKLEEIESIGYFDVNRFVLYNSEDEVTNFFA